MHTSASGLMLFAPYHSGVSAKDCRFLTPAELSLLPCRLNLAACTRRQETRVWSHMSLSDLNKVTFTLRDKFFICKVKRAEPDGL